MRVRNVHKSGLAILATLALAVGLSACAPDGSIDTGAPPQVDAQLEGDTLTQMQAAVDNAMKATGSSGAIVGVWAPWAGTWVAGIGQQSPTDDTPVAADMTFRVGTMTRAMVCDALYLAAADGSVALDDSISTYVRGVPDLEDITLLELCNSTAGIGSYAPALQASWLGNPARVWDPRELASFGLGDDRTPEGTYRGSDAGYLLLGMALERATGKSASELLADRVFEPLGLESTSLPEGTGQWSSRASLRGGLSPKPGGVVNCAEPIDVTGVSTTTGYTDSGVVSTISDLGRYTQALATRALMKDSEVAEGRYAKPLPATASAPAWYTSTGGTIQAGSLIGQYGAVPGYITGAFADPETGLTVAVVLNNSVGGSGFGAYLAWELAAIASKAPAADGATAPQFGLPWTAEQYHTAIANAAVCT